MENGGWLSNKNIPHRPHEYLQRVAFELLWIIYKSFYWMEKKGDYTPQAIFYWI